MLTFSVLKCLIPKSNISLLSSYKIPNVGNKVTQRVEEFAAKPNGLSSLFEIYVVEGENQLTEVTRPSSCGACVYTNMALRDTGRQVLRNPFLPFHNSFRQIA